MINESLLCKHDITNSNWNPSVLINYLYMNHTSFFLMSPIPYQPCIILPYPTLSHPTLSHPVLSFDCRSSSSGELVFGSVRRGRLSIGSSSVSQFPRVCASRYGLSQTKSINKRYQHNRSALTPPTHSLTYPNHLLHLCCTVL